MRKKGLESKSVSPRANNGIVHLQYGTMVPPIKGLRLEMVWYRRGEVITKPVIIFLPKLIDKGGSMFDIRSGLGQIKVSSCFFN